MNSPFSIASSANGFPSNSISFSPSPPPPPPPQQQQQQQSRYPPTRDMFTILTTPSLYGPVETITILCICFQLWTLLFLPFLPRVYYILSFLFWRLSYNLGLGVILYHQSKSKSITRFLTTNISSNTRSLLAWAVSRPVITSNMWDKSPLSFNAWLLFRALATIILTNDGIAYIVLVISCFTPLSQSSMSTLFLTLPFVVPLALIGVWSKYQAHHVVKDYAWFWGDFFFLLDNNNNSDDNDDNNKEWNKGIFAICPHPMYTIGYAPYYAAVLLCRSYTLLLISLIAHALQMAFLHFVEQPHIDITYNNNNQNNKILTGSLSTQSKLTRSSSSSYTSSTSSSTTTSSTSSSSTSSSSSSLTPSSSFSRRLSLSTTTNTTSGHDNPALRLFEQAAPHFIVHTSIFIFATIFSLLSIYNPPSIYLLLSIFIIIRISHWLFLAIVLTTTTTTTSTSSNKQPQQQTDNRWVTFLRSKGISHSRIFSTFQHTLTLSIALNHALFFCVACITTMTGKQITFLEIFNARGAALSMLGIVMIFIGHSVCTDVYQHTGDFAYYYGDFFVSVGNNSSSNSASGNSALNSSTSGRLSRRRSSLTHQPHSQNVNHNDEQAQQQNQPKWTRLSSLKASPSYNNHNVQNENNHENVNNNNNDLTTTTNTTSTTLTTPGTTTKKKNEFYCQSGPYRFLNHPQAVCFYLIYYGIALICQSPIAFILSLFSQLLHFVFISGIETVHIQREYNCSTTITPFIKSLFSIVPILLKPWNRLQMNCRDFCNLIVSRCVNDIYINKIVKSQRQLMKHIDLVKRQTWKKLTTWLHEKVHEEIITKVSSKQVLMKLRSWGMIVHDVGPSLEG